MFKAVVQPLNDVFRWFAFWMKTVLQTLDFPFYDGVSYLRLIIGFICLSAVITVFWKGIRG